MEFWRRLTALAPILLFGQDASQGIQSAQGRSDRLVERISIEALDKFADLSTRYNLSFSGVVCRRADGSHFAPPLSFSEFESSTQFDSCPIKTLLVARYHTHGKYGVAGPTGFDLTAADRMPDVTFYLLTSCGSIVKWHGPDAAVNIATARRCQ